MAKILIAGASGTIGHHLMPYLQALGHMVSAYNRKEPQSLEGFDVVINLAGVPLFPGRWTSRKKEEIFSSRIQTTKQLVDAMKLCHRPPQLFISASAVGYYGNCYDVTVTEDTPCGKGFLADVCASWEDEALQATSCGVRVIRLRLGTVLTADGGALAKLIPLFKLGLGAVLGSGKQWMSWITIRDLLSLFRFCLETQISGPINAVSPFPVTNKEFTNALAGKLHRSVYFRAPAWLLRLMLGREQAEEALLTSIKAIPCKLMAGNFQFQDEKIDQALVY